MHAKDLIIDYSYAASGTMGRIQQKNWGLVEGSNVG